MFLNFYIGTVKNEKYLARDKIYSFKMKTTVMFMKQRFLGFRLKYVKVSMSQLRPPTAQSGGGPGNIATLVTWSLVWRLDK